MTGSDVSQLTQLSRDLGRLGSPEFAENLKPAMRATAGVVKDSWNGKLYRDGSAKHTGRSISFDVGVAHDFDLFATDVGDVSSSALIAEIGARHSAKQAFLTRWLENGTIHNAPRGYGAAALMESADDFERAIAFAEAAAAGRFGL